MFRFYLDNTLVSDPINWADFTETIEFDETLKALLPKYENKLTFSGSGYAYLYSQFKTNGYCKLVQLKVDYQCDANSGYSTILNGFIFISDAIFNLNKFTVECDVMDNNYGSKIFNNKSIKAKLNVGKSKNGLTITPCSYNDIRMFTPSTGVYSATTRRVYDIGDAFRFLITFMTDGDVGYESNFLTTFTDLYGVEGLKLTTGQEIRLHDQLTAPFISFEELFHEIDIKYPLGFTIIDVSGVPTIKIEEIAYFKNTTPSINIANIDNLKQSFNSQILFSKIKFGSTFLNYDGFQYHYPQIRFFSFADEEYHLQGKCNIDRTLDLTGDIISDTNLIEGCFATDTNNSTYDNNLFFIQTIFYDPGGYTRATAAVDPVTNTLPFFYNKNLQNNFIAERYNLQGDIALYLGSADDLFRAEKTVYQDISADFAGVGLINPTPTVSALILFENDSTGGNFDVNGNYNNTTFRYTSPASGSYEFVSEISIDVNGYGLVDIQVCYNVYDAGNVLQSQQFGEFNFCDMGAVGDPPSSKEFLIKGSKNIFLISGWYVTVSLSAISNINSSIFYHFYALATSFFSCTESINGGGVYQSEVPGDYFVSKFEFAAPISNDEYVTMKADLSKAVVINNDGQTNRTTWIRKLVRKLATSETKWEMISSINNSQ